ncbi:hypothetical protein CRE_21630 [Caenorhabditis remanei]|uniref:DUF19 domain-containing protein n=1 Tax=Caenorhabditis remanei TaxID=31234 RepID=E3NP71_CAERE|nr:hypothetical protein CRE_21630 [Caenorhabditis remanei]
MFFFTLLLLPFSISGQTDYILNPACLNEFNEIYSCVRNQSLFQYFESSPRDDSALNHEISEELQYVLACSGPLHCPISQIFRSFLYQKKCILDYYNENLEACAGMYVVLDVWRRCGTGDVDDDFFELDEKCAVVEFLNHSTCDNKDASRFLLFTNLVRSFYESGIRYGPEIKHYIEKISISF